MALISGFSYILSVKRVIDGDTLECDKLKVRACGIDAPELSQPFGNAAATTKLTQLTLNKNVRLVTQGTDIYGRILAEVWINK